MQRLCRLQIKKKKRYVLNLDIEKNNIILSRNSHNKSQNFARCLCICGCEEVHTSSWFLKPLAMTIREAHRFLERLSGLCYEITTAQGHLLVKKARSELSSLSPTSFLQSGSSGNKIINLECYKILSHNSRSSYKSKLPCLLLGMCLLWFLEMKASKKWPFKCY